MNKRKNILLANAICVVYFEFHHHHHHHHHPRISSQRKSWTKLQGRYDDDNNALARTVSDNILLCFAHFQYNA